MNSFIAKIMHRLRTPQHELSCSWWLWWRLLVNLRRHSHGATRESGAFLLGHRVHARARIIDFVLYDDLDPHSLDTGIVRLDGRYFGALWDICKRRGMTVIADVHTHPGDSGQSESDQAHPIITRSGHLALIVPRFAKLPVRRAEVGVYRYQGSGRWETIPRARRGAFFHLGFWGSV
jgi:proteasome lid subunit RPN8/RPN11